MKNNLKNPLIRRILFRYVATIVIAFAILTLIPFTILIVMNFWTWYGDEFIYRLVYFFYNNLIATFLISGIALWLAITFYFFSKIASYLNETIHGTSQLLANPEQRIKLSPDLVAVQDEMNELRENNNRTQRAAKEAEQRKNDLIVYLAHDLRTPLTSVIGYLTLLKEEPQLSLDMRARYTDIALDKAERLEQLINEFFEITRFNLTTLTLNKQVIDLSIMLEQISYEFLPILEEKNLQWQLEIEKEVLATVDAEKMERVFDNLIRNAINYSFADSVITLELAKKEQIEITFSNSGYTIPPEKLARIFEPFYRMDSSRASATGGTGLGLPIAKDIVEALGGMITAASRDNQIIFTISLPLRN
ncbi:vancomycin resistance histidine kinase VanS [Enterococcus sp. LJL120]